MKPTQKKPTKAQSFAQPKKPDAKAKPGATEQKSKAKNFFEKVNPIYLAAGALVAVLVIGLLAYLMIGNPEPEVVENRPPEIDEFAMDEELDPIYPADHYMSSPTPVRALAAQAAQKAIREHPKYILGQGLAVSADDIMYENSPELIALQDEVTTSVALDLAAKTEETQDPNTGKVVLRVLDQTTGRYAPINSEVTAASFEDQAFRAASTVVDSQLAQREMLRAQNNVLQESTTEVVEKKVVVESVLSDEEKRRYIDLIDTQERENKKLRAEIADLQQEMLEQRKQVVSVIQKIEDSPTANMRLKASMLPKSTGLKLHSITGDRVWFEDANGKLITHSIGEVIDGTNLMISGTDEGTGIVQVTQR